MVIYNKALKTQITRRLSMALLLASGSFASLFADNRLIVQDFSIAENGNYVVSVKMENDPDVVSLAATVKLPAGLTIVKQYDESVDKDVNFVLNTARTYDPAQLYDEQSRERHRLGDNNDFQHKNEFIMSITHRKNLPFIGNSGDEIFQFEVHAANPLVVGKTDSIVIDNISFSKKIENPGEEPQIVKDKENDRTVAKFNVVAELAPTAIIYPAEYSFSMYPGYENRHVVAIKMNNNSNVYSMEGRITLPEGMRIITGVEGYQAGINNSPRAKELGPDFNFKTGKFILSTDEQGDYKIIEGDGEIFAFIVEANNNLVAESQIKLSDFVVTTKYLGELYTMTPKNFVINVSNLGVASKATAAREMVDSLEEVIEGLTVGEEVKAYAENDPELQALVDQAVADSLDARDSLEALDQLVEELIAAGTVATDAGQQAIADAKQKVENAIARAEASIQAATDLYNEKYGIEEQKRKANEDAYNRLSGDIDRLQYKLNNAEDDIERNYPEVAPDFADDEAAIQQMIDNLRDSIAEKRDAVELDAESQLNPAQVKAINDAIVKLAQDVKAAQEKIEADKKKFAEDKAAMTEEVGGLQDQLDDLQDALDAIQNVSDEDKEPVQDMIDAIQEQIDAIVNALDDAENLDDLDAIADLILDVENNLDEVAQAIDDLKISNVQGDITGEGDVDIDDYYALLDVVMDQDFIDALDPDSKEFEKYDVNRNGKINSADLAAIINIYVYGNVEGPSGVRQMTGMDAVMSVSGSKRMALNLGNAAGFIGAQTDIVLPEGMSITGVELGELAGNHKVTTRKQKDGSVRILVSSTSNALFNGAEGTLVYINVAGNGTASFRNTSLISADAQSVDLTISAAETTGISSVSAKADSQATVYSLGGRLMNAVKKGVNIIRRADGTTKKVIR